MPKAFDYSLGEEKLELHYNVIKLSVTGVGLKTYKGLVIIYTKTGLEQSWEGFLFVKTFQRVFKQKGNDLQNEQDVPKRKKKLVLPLIQQECKAIGWSHCGW